MKSLLKLSGVTKIYNQGKIDESSVFDNFGFEVGKGQFISIVGSNGSGKTTLLNIISGNAVPTSGKVELADADGTMRDITKAKEYVRAKRIGRVFQDSSLGTAPYMTIAENLALAENKGKRAGLKFALNKKKTDYYRGLVEPLGLGLEDKMNVAVSSLSGGQRQALSLVISTLTPLDLLLLDEHTASLDPKTSEIIMRLTDKIIREKNLTAIMVTHNLRYAVEYGNRIIMFDKGKAVVDAAGEDKEKWDINSLLKVFNAISIECGN